MLLCKKCKSEQIVKNGIVAGRQRYQCKNCKYNFREGDNRTNEGIAAKKALCLLLYTLGKAHTYTIEGGNSDTRHHIGRFTRRTKVVSHCDYMVRLTLKAWVAVAFGDLFATIQSILLSIF